MRTTFKKRIVSLLLAVLMVAGLAAPALSITIAVVTTESKFKDGELISLGDGSYTVTIRYSKDAGIPDGARIAASEVTDAEAYQTAVEAMLKAGQTAVMSRFFDIEIVNEAGESVTLLAPVEVVIDVADAPEESTGVSVFHFKDTEESQTEADGAEEIPDPEVPLDDSSFDTIEQNGIITIEGAKYVADASLTTEEYAEDDFDEGHKESEAVVEEVRVTSNNGSVVSFLADGFSVYGIVYTVDFSYSVDGKELAYSLVGGSGIGLSELLPLLGVVADDPETEDDEVHLFTEKISAVSFSNPEYVWIGKVETDTTVGDIVADQGLTVEYSAELSEEEISALKEKGIGSGEWTLISLKAFSTQETLTVTMTDGQVWTIKVTDAQISTRVITADGKDYLITVTYDKEAEIPDGAVLEAVEIPEGTDEYNAYVVNAMTALHGDMNENDYIHYEVAYARFFDISIKLDDNKIEPKAPVSVSIDYMGSVLDGSQDMGVVHFAKDGTEVLSAVAGASEDKTTVSFEQEVSP